MRFSFARCAIESIGLDDAGTKQFSYGVFPGQYTSTENISMIAVIFEVEPLEDHRQDYLDADAALRLLLQHINGFISIERFQSLTQADRILLLSYWRDEQVVQEWGNLEQHRYAQSEGRQEIFSDYRLRVAQVLRTCGTPDREQASDDSYREHGDA